MHQQERADDGTDKQTSRDDVSSQQSLLVAIGDLHHQPHAGGNLAQGADQRQLPTRNRDSIRQAIARWLLVRRSDHGQ